MAGGFNANTRQKFVQLPTMTRPTGGGNTSIQLPKTGFLARIWLKVTGSISGTLSSPNAYGMSSVLKRVSVVANSGINVFSLTGPSIHYLLAELMEEEDTLKFAQTNARSAVTATTFNVSCFIPIALNFRDPIGLIALQNEQTILTLSIDWEADATVATGATVTATCVPFVELFTVPVDVKDWPPLNTVHQIIDEVQTVAGAGDYTYYIPRGNVLLQYAQGLGFGVSGSDAFSAWKWRVNQSEYFISSTDTAFFDMLHWGYRGRARPAGCVYLDLMASSGLGTYGLTRDVFNTGGVTDLATITTATGAGSLYVLRRQLITLQ